MYLLISRGLAEASAGRAASIASAASASLYRSPNTRSTARTVSGSSGSSPASGRSSACTRRARSGSVVTVGLRKAEWKLHDLLQEPPAECRPLPCRRVALTKRGDEFLVRHLDMCGDQRGLHGQHEDAVRELPGQEQVDGLDHLRDRAWRAAIEVVHEHHQWTVLTGHQAQHLADVVVYQVQEAEPVGVPGIGHQP